MKEAVIYCDGGSRGNPGPAGCGFVIVHDGKVVCRGGRYIGIATNNVAEYRALIWALENARELGYDSVTVYADSELLVKQVAGVYRVKNAGLKPLFVEVLGLLRGFSSYKVEHVFREQNAEADALANQAMDARSTVGDPACERPAGSDALF